MMDRDKEFIKLLDEMSKTNKPLSDWFRGVKETLEKEKDYEDED